MRLQKNNKERVDNMEENNELVSYSRVKPEEKRSWGSIAFVWIGSSVCVPALMVGGMIGVGLPFGQAVLAMAIGFLLVCTYMVFIGMQGSDLGLPTTAILTRAFGERGSTIASGLVLAISLIGWFGMNTVVCGSAFCSLLSSATGGYEFPLWLANILWGAAMLATAVFGIKSIDVLNKIAVPALVIMLVWGLIHALGDGGSAVVSAWVPSQPIPFIAGVTLAVSGFAIGAVLASDYTRFNKTRKDTTKACLWGVFPASILVLSIGGILAITTGSYDLTLMFANMGLPIIGLICLILATWTTNVGNAYSGGIAILGIFKIKSDKRSIVTCVAGVIGIILAITGIMNYFSSFLSFLSVLVPPMAGVVIADYWIVGKGNAAEWKPFKGVNWLGILSWVCGTAFAMIFNFFVPTINGVIVAMLVYFVLCKTVKSEKANPFAAKAE